MFGPDGAWRHDRRRRTRARPPHRRCLEEARPHNLVLKGVNLEAEARPGGLRARPLGCWQEHATALRQCHRIGGSRRGLCGQQCRRSAAREKNGVPFVRMSESEVSRAAPPISAWCFRSFNLFPHMSVLDNITDAPMRRARRKADRGRGERAHGLLRRVGLSDKARELPSPSFGRPAAAHRHRPSLGDAAQAHAVR